VKTKRSYRQFCGVAKALDVLGERWTLLIVRNLLVGGLRYKDLQETLPGITTNLLAERLRDMVEAGLITQRELPRPAPATVYELTPLGRELEPVVLALGRFGARYLTAPKRGEHTHVRWAMVTLKRRYRGSSSTPSIAFVLDDGPGEPHRYRVRMQPDTLAIEEGPSFPGDDVRVRMNADSFRALLFRSESAHALVRSGAIQLEGKAQAFYELIAAVGATR
jgi:DNA-binding HxlR family transcriptional regulator